MGRTGSGYLLLFLRVCSAVKARLAVSSRTQLAWALALIESPPTGLAAQDQSKSRLCYIPQHPDRSHTSNAFNDRSKTQLAKSPSPAQVSTALLF